MYLNLVARGLYSVNFTRFQPGLFKEERDKEAVDLGWQVGWMVDQLEAGRHREEKRLAVLLLILLLLPLLVGVFKNHKPPSQLVALKALYVAPLITSLDHE